MANPQILQDSHRKPPSMSKRAMHGGAHQTVKAEWIIWLSKDPNSVKLVPSQGIVVTYAKITGLIDLSWSTIPFPLSFSSCFFVEGINLYGANIRDLTFQESVIGSFIFYNINWQALVAQNSIVQGDVVLGLSKFHSGVSFRNARVSGTFFADFASFSTKDKEQGPGTEDALDLAFAKIGTGIRLWAADLVGLASFANSEINGRLEGTLFSGDGRFYGDGMKVSGDVNLCTNISRDISIRRSIIEGDLSIVGVTPEKPEITEGKLARVDATATKVDGNVYIRSHLNNKGIVSFSNANISGAFELQGKSLEGVLELNDAKIGILSNPERNWPASRSLQLSGFVFNELGGKASLDSKVQLRSLRLQSPRVSQPYQQMATVFRNMGYEDESLEVNIAEKWDQGLESFRLGLKSIASSARMFGKEIIHLAIGKMFVRTLQLVQAASQFVFYNILWFFCFGWSIQYGYRPWNALFISIAFVLFGAIVFQSAQKNNILKKKDSEASRGRRDRYNRRDQHFVALIYSLETFVPLVNFGVARDWQIEADVIRDIHIFRFRFRQSGVATLWYFWIHVTAGWVFTSLWVAAFTGILKH